MVYRQIVYSLTALGANLQEFRLVRFRLVFPADHQGFRLMSFLPQANQEPQASIGLQFRRHMFRRMFHLVH